MQLKIKNYELRIIYLAPLRLCARKTWLFVIYIIKTLFHAKPQSRKEANTQSRKGAKKR